MARLREAGAVILGKTTTPEFGWKAIGDSPADRHHPQPVEPGAHAGRQQRRRRRRLRRRHRARCMSAATAPARSASRRPSPAFSASRRPSAGCRRYPASPMGLLSNVGPMTRSVRDAALMLNVLARPDHRDPYALPPRAPDVSRRHRGRRPGLAHRLQPRSRLCQGRSRDRRLRRQRRRSASRSWARMSSRSARSSTRRARRC